MNSEKQLTDVIVEIRYKIPGDIHAKIVKQKRIMEAQEDREVTMERAFCEIVKLAKLPEFSVA